MGLDAPAPGADTSLPEPIREAFLEELRGTVEPLAARLGAALGHLGPAGMHWVAAPAACPCSQAPGPEIPCLNGSPRDKRVCQAVELTYLGRPAGKAVICCDSSAGPVAAALRQLVCNPLH